MRPSRADLIERKAFLRSFIRRIEVHDGQVTVYYQLPMPPDGKDKEEVGVLPIVTFGGPNITFAKPIETFFELSIGSAPSPFGEQSNEPK